MTILRPWRREPWHPTPEQEEVALRLADSNGGLVRTYADGTAELRTVSERGAVCRYLIEKGGDAKLIDAGPETGRMALGDRLWAAGMMLGLGAPILAIMIVKSWRLLWGLPDRVDTILGGVAFFGLGLGLAVAIAGLAIRPSTKPPRGEHWRWIGGPSH